jgi:hypothetical protein
MTQGTAAYAQFIKTQSYDPEDAYDNLKKKHYPEAIRQFTALSKNDPGNANYLLSLAKAYNYSSIDPKKALKILEDLNKDLKRPLGSFYELGVAYHRNYRFDNALQVFEELKFASQDPNEIAHLQKWIDMSNRARIMMNDPVEVRLENLGEDVNSPGPDFLPIVEPDESAVYFTSRRAEVTGKSYDSSGYYTADVFISRNRSDKYSKAKSIGSLNTDGNEYTAGRSENGEYLVYHVDNQVHISNLLLSEKGRKSYMDPKEIDSKYFKQPTSTEIAAAISNDGRRIYFSSDRKGGMGGFDIWVIRRLPTGDWSEAENLGSPINTAGDEKYPYMRGDEDLMYFSSDGHPGIGGMDLFMANREKESRIWNEPKNMGFPVNTTEDDLSICYAAHSRYAYIGSRRKDGYGDLDIYRLIFKDIKPEYTLLGGMVMNEDSSLISVKVLIEVFDQQTGKLYGSYLVNPNTGRYHTILPPGEYRIDIHDIYGYHNFKEEIKILGKGDFVPRRQMNIYLKRDPEQEKPKLDTQIERKSFK